MNKTRNQFHTLPEQDRNLILDLCSKHSYEEAIEIISRPRPEGGLGLVTSRSALCRFYTTWHPEPAREVLAQYAAAAHVRHQYDSNAFLGAIRAAVEARVLEHLKNGKALPDMEKDFKLLKTAQSLYLEDSRWRTENPKASRAAYNQFVQLCATGPDNDFVPLDQLEKRSPDRPAVLPGEFALDLSNFQVDLLNARRSIEARSEQHDARIEAAQKAADVPQPGHAAPANSPVIPHIPRNSTSENAESNATSTPTNSNEPKPKLGRNDPCPCGSGLKYKKCCLFRTQQDAEPLAA
jgi:hypothetical protein